MKLITKELERTFSKYPIYSQESMILDARVIVKYFNPVGAGTWLITEAENFLMEIGGYLGICISLSGSGDTYSCRNFRILNFHMD